MDLDMDSIWYNLFITAWFISQNPNSIFPLDGKVINHTLILEHWWRKLITYNIKIETYAIMVEVAETI